MTPVLHIGPKNYASWSMGPWVVLTYTGLPFVEHVVPLFSAPDWAQNVAAVSPSGKLPVLVDGPLVVHESLAICEYLADRHPEFPLWPRDAHARARARALSSELATSFEALRTDMPMNCRGYARDFLPGDKVVDDIERIVSIWEQCSEQPKDGPFLFGEFGIVDALFANVASRFRTYGVGLSGAAGEYADMLLDMEAVRDWFEGGSADARIPRYDAALL